jgi:hypothetical protein
MSCKRLHEMHARHQRRLSVKGLLTRDTANVETLPDDEETELSLKDGTHHSNTSKYSLNSGSNIKKHSIQYQVLSLSAVSEFAGFPVSSGTVPGLFSLHTSFSHHIDSLDTLRG